MKNLCAVPIIFEVEASQFTRSHVADCIHGGKGPGVVLRYGFLAAYDPFQFLREIRKHRVDFFAQIEETLMLGKPRHPGAWQGAGTLILGFWTRGERVLWNRQEVTKGSQRAILVGFEHL